MLREHDLVGDEQPKPNARGTALPAMECLEKVWLYVNAFRLQEVRRRLLDARHDQVPILTMALEAGFGSIVAFNRAFKEKYAMTPTAYRAQRDGVGHGMEGGGVATAPDRKATKAGDGGTSLAG